MVYEYLKKTPLEALANENGSIYEINSLVLYNFIRIRHSFNDINALGLVREIWAEMLSKWNDSVFVSLCARHLNSGLKGEVIERTGWSCERANKVPQGDERRDYI